MANLNFGFNIHTFSFDSAGLQQASEVKNATNWPVTYSGAYPFTFRQPIKHKIAFKSTILYPFIP